MCQDMSMFQFGFGNNLGYLIRRALLCWQDSQDEAREGENFIKRLLNFMGQIQ